MKHLDLFSGIGGFALAVDRVWQNAEHTFCEIDPFCQEVLKKHWPNSYIHDDIRTLTNSEGRESREQTKQEGWKDISRSGCDLLTGGFPCQPFSQAGKRGGTTDNRYLWPEMLRVIQEFKPTWVIAENVRGLLTIEQGLVFEQVCTDLEASGYEVQPIIIPAVAVNAPHRRDRVWFIGRRLDGDTTKNGNTTNRKVFGGGQGDKESTDTERGLEKTKCTASNTNGKRGRTQGNGYNGDWSESNERFKGQSFDRVDGQDSNASDTSDKGLERWNTTIRQKEGRHSNTRYSGEGVGSKDTGWNRSWLEVATRLCGVFNGVSSRLYQTLNDGVYYKYAKTLNKITEQALPCLWQGFQSEAFQWSIGRFNTIQNKDYLFTVLWQLSHQLDYQDNLPFESEKVQDAYLRNVWDSQISGRSSHRWEYSEQYAREHKDALSQLSYEVALATEEIWRAYNKDRNPRLKALGNAIVPQVAEEIMRAIID